jgi:hypothetical protein
VFTGSLSIKGGKVVSYTLDDPVPHRLDGFSEEAALEILKKHGWEKVVSDGLLWEDHITKVRFNPNSVNDQPRIYKSELR